MSAPASCPRCEKPTTDGLCLHCVFSAALTGLAGEDGIAEPAGQAAPEGYELLQPLGVGATANVWLAREIKLNRLVALKFISSAADPRLRQRLVREGQAVARLRHRHIVAVHAMDFDERHAYLAMDYFEGGDLHRWLAHKLPTPREAAVLVRKLADALAHAHASGLLHRDIKPSNVLLDAQGEPHLADFGLVAPLAGAGDVTMPGQVAGTAAYLAPELLAGAESASPQSDLYALGAVLYECLTGRAPFLGESNANIFAQLASEEPPAPRLLRPGIPRDLETICLKCLEKTPARRYVSAEALREDLDRFTRGEPIAARPITRLGRTLRWCRRHPGTAALAGLAGVLVLLLSIGGPLLALRLARANSRAETEAATSRAVSDFLKTGLLAQAAPENEPDRDLRVRTLLDRAATKLDGQFPEQPRVESEVRDTIATTYFSLGELESARAQWQRTYDLQRRVFGPDNPITLRVGSNLSTALRALSRFAEADEIGTDVLARQRRVLAPTDNDLAETLNNLGMLRRNQTRFAEAETFFNEAVQIRRATFGVDHPLTLTVMNNLVILYRSEGKLSEAEALNADILVRRRQSLGPEHPDTLHSLNLGAVLLSDLARFAEAEKATREVLQLRQKILGMDHPETVACSISLAVILRNLGNLTEAETLSSRALEFCRQRLGPDQAMTFQAASCLARVWHEAGRLTEAEALLVDLVPRERRVLGAGHPTTTAALLTLGRVYFEAGKLDEAQAAAAEVRELVGNGAGAKATRRSGAIELLGRIALQRSRPVDAEKFFREAVELRSKSANEGWETWVARGYLGETLLAQSRFEEAEPLLRDCEAGLRKELPKIPAGSRKEIEQASARLEKLHAARPRSAKTDA